MKNNVQKYIFLTVSVIFAININTATAQAQNSQTPNFTNPNPYSNASPKTPVMKNSFFSPKNNSETDKVIGLNDLLSLNVSNYTEKQNKQLSDVSEMRKEAIASTAAAVGASAGLNNKMNQFREKLETKKELLDELSNFYNIKLENGILPPVLTEGIANYSQPNDDEVRISDKMYKIEFPARFVSSYPNWRNYISFSFPSFELPPMGFLPKNEGEKIVWDEWVKKGWEQGQIQAINIFESSWGRLERDFLGMIKFDILAEQGLITKPVVAKINMGVTGGGKELSINDQVFRITDHASLDSNTTKWKVDYPVTFEYEKRTK